MRKYICMIFILIFFTNCERKENWILDTQSTDLIVVDAIITSERKEHIICINHPVEKLNEEPLPVAGATVLINDEDSVYYLTEKPVNSGRYVTSPYFFCRLNKNYKLLINFEDKVYTAKTYMVAGDKFEILEYEKNSFDNLYHIKWVASQFDFKDPAMWEVLLDWSKAPGYIQANPDTCRARLLFYTLPTVDVSQIFAPEIEKVYFPLGTIINQRRYSLNPEHAEFIRTLLSETSWQGGLFSSVPANIYTNLSEGAVGFFGACEVTAVSQTVK